MAPGRGRRPRGETRMDAALDAMHQLGFDRKPVRKKVNELLKVYGGPDGWVFIEEASYKLLIEELLGGDEGSEPGPPLLTGDSGNLDDMLGDAGSSSAPGPLNTTDMVSPLMDAGKTCADGSSHQDSALTLADDVSFPQQDLTNNTDNALPPQVDHSPPPSPLEIRHTPLPPLPPPPPPPESDYVPPPPPPAAGPTMPPRKRRPCYGWWGDETGDIIRLSLMPLPPKRACRRPVNAR